MEGGRAQFYVPNICRGILPESITFHYIHKIRLKTRMTASMKAKQDE